MATPGNIGAQRCKGPAGPRAAMAVAVVDDPVIGAYSGLLISSRMVARQDPIRVLSRNAEQISVTRIPNMPLDPRKHLHPSVNAVGQWPPMGK